MLKSSVLYRRLWYAKRRNSKRINLFLRISAILIILLFLATYAQKSIFPYIISCSEYKLRAEVASIVNDAIKKSFDGSLEYDRVADVVRDSKGNIISIKTNTAVLNSISAIISGYIQERLASMNEDKLSLPVGAILGSSLFAGSGPEVYVKIRPYGNVETRFRSELTSAGWNSTRHSIVLEVTTKFGIIVPLTEKKFEMTTDIPIVETVIKDAADV